MALDVNRLLRERGITKTITFEMPRFTKVYEEELASIYLQALRGMWSPEAIRNLVTEYSNALTVRDSVEDELSAAEGRTVQILLTFRRNWRAWAQKGFRNHFKTLVSRMKYATNIDLSTSMNVAGDDATIEDLLNWNTELIRNISEETRQKIASIVYSGLTNRTPVSRIAGEIQEASGMARKRARRVASDQTVKLSSALDAQRMKDLGMEGYQWQHSRKAHPREEHVARNGKFYKFGGKTDREDPPGYKPFCGCKRKAVLNSPPGGWDG